MLVLGSIIAYFLFKTLLNEAYLKKVRVFYFMRKKRKSVKLIVSHVEKEVFFPRRKNCRNFESVTKKSKLGNFCFFPTSNNLFWEQQFSLTCTEATLQAANTLIGKHHTNSLVFVYGQTDADRQTQNQSKLLWPVKLQ